MISIDRNSIEKPKFFTSKDYEEQINSLKEFYLNSERSQKRFLDYSLPFDVVYALEGLFNNKCAYCESHISLSANKSMESVEIESNFDTFDGIDHFRPRNNAQNFFTKNTSLEHYWWLTYEWRNLYYCCQECRRYKTTWFHVDGKRSAIETNYDEIIVTEKSMLIDPCNDKIEPHLTYDTKTGKVISKTEKGKITIRLLNLNRTNLIQNRLSATKEEERILTKIIKSNKLNKKGREEIIQRWNELFSGSSHKSYIAIRREAIFLFMKNKPELELTLINEVINYSQWTKEFQKEEQKKKGRIKPRPIKIDTIFAKKENIESIIPNLNNIRLEKIEVKNYKCFDKLTIDFLDTNNSPDYEPWLVFLGENGVGKSSLLKGIAVALMGQKNIDKLQLKPSRYLQYGKRVGYIKLYGKGENEIFEVKFNKTKITSNIQDPSSYIIGYGSTRLLPKGELKPETGVEYVKIKNLFDYSVALSDAKSWLLNDVSNEMFNQVAISLKDLLLLANDDVIKRNKSKNELFIKYAKAGNQIDVDELSDGYKTIFALTVDLIKTLSKDNIAFEIAEGIILIDEIGTHLHPRWKMEVVKRLRKTFPKLQFIATTHEPLCLRGLSENEVIVLKKDNEGEIIAITDLPSPNEFRVDQLLTSEYFGLNSTMDFETEDLFKEYYKLIAKEDDEITKEEEKRRDELSEILPNKKHLGDDIRDELVYYVIDQLLAKQVNDKGYKIIDDTIRKEAVDKVKLIWEHIEKNETAL